MSQEVKYTSEMVGFANTQSMSVELNNNAKQINLRLLREGVEGQTCTYVGPLDHHAETVLFVQGRPLSLRPPGTYTRTAEIYADGSMNIYVGSSDRNFPPIGFIRVRRV